MNTSPIDFGVFAVSKGHVANPIPASGSGVRRRSWLEGDYADLPLVEILALALERQLNGSLVVTEKDGTDHVVHLYRGVPAKARTAGHVAPLRSVLVWMGAVDEETLTNGSAWATPGQGMLGEQLMSTGVISEQTLFEALRMQVAMRVSYLMGLGEQTRYEFRAGTDLLRDYGGNELTPCRPLALILHGARMLDEGATVQRRLAALGDRPLKVHPDFDERAFDLDPAEEAIVELLRKHPCSLEVLRASRLAADSVVSRLIYALVLTHGLDVQRESVPPIRVPRIHPVIHRVPRTAAVQPTVVTESAEVFGVPSASSIRAKLSELERQSAAERLEVDADAGTDEIDAGYLYAMRPWLPERLPATLAAHRRGCAEICRLLAEAHAELTGR